MSGSSIKIVEIAPGNTLKINSNLTFNQEQQLLQVITKHSAKFSCDYVDMKGIQPNTKHDPIYIKGDSLPIRQP